MYQKKIRGAKPWIIMGLVLASLVWLLYALGDVLTPFIVAAVLAYILNPLVEKLRHKGVKRGLASMLVMIFSLLVLLALVLIIVPMLINQFNNIVMRLPQMIDFVQNKLLPWLNDIAGEHIKIDTQTVVAWLQAHTGELNNAFQKLAPTLMRQSGNVVVGVTNLMLLPFLLYYFLLDWQRWSHGIRALIPRRFIDTYMRVSGNMDKVLSEFLRGQLMVMLIMGLIYGIGLMFTGLDSGFAIGMIAGILVFVPYLGAFTGLLLATLAALLQFGSWQGLLMVWAVFGVGQFLESFFITPKIVGDRIGLSPFWVIFSLMAFGQLMGFVGMLVGLPLAAVTLVLLREGADMYFKSRFYKHK
ncbi:MULTISPECIES: AI-2E family transporter [unclassified Neisseria]|uniref:AI-2E family transporter n=1 Tax=unclassified Neisseria TaxID=2623750 RepID=UPI002665C8FB|nr:MULTISPECIES: AI-2E family transporter [unclassified Neisseria]MDO1508907.1 AI-2E family transporter [Neisseria sp. MVDL19-042950]MDO1515166.1 AI-2E family transporter [Neisseria sp. MVDL18-041461]MDO1562526.1 AI-2E family transporter [Neisseria sp. MVDL20-010259]